jgi:hypothetical protein
MSHFLAGNSPPSRLRHDTLPYFVERERVAKRLREELNEAKESEEDFFNKVPVVLPYTRLSAILNIPDSKMEECAN